MRLDKRNDDDIERRGKPSKWVTLRVLRVLRVL